MPWRSNDRLRFDVLAGLIEEEGASARLTMGSIAEEEVRMLLKQPWMMISSDGKEAASPVAGATPVSRQLRKGAGLLRQRAWYADSA